MANQRTDTQSVINLVINGKQAMTSLRELTDTQRRLNTEMRNMRPNNPEYPARLREIQAVNEAITQQRRLMSGVNDESKKLKESWAEIAAGVVGGNLLSNMIESGIGAVSDFVSGAKAAYAESEQGQAQLQAVLKSTGNVAGKSKEQLDSLAQSIMHLTGVDDDVITKSESLLLTFTNVRGEIFDQTLPAIVDMTAALNNGNVSMETIQGTTLQVGKALNDPIKGMTALRKVGVSFTEDQIKTVKSMVATNDVAGAQKIILAELSKEFGNVGQALASTDTGKAMKFETRLGNIQESLGAMQTSGKSTMIEFLNPFVTMLERATETRLSDTLDKDRASLSSNIVQLKASNTSHETRVGIIKSLKEQYPAYLSQIDAEKVSNEKLLPVLNNINKALVMKIAFTKKNEDLNHAMEDEADLFLKSDKAATQLAQTMSSILDNAKGKGLNIVIPKNLTDIQQADFLIKQLNASVKSGTGVHVSMNVHDIEIAKLNLQQLRKAYSDAGADSNKLLESQNSFANRYGLDANGNTKTMASNNVTPPVQPASSGLTGITEKQKSEKKKALDDFNKLGEEYAKLEIDRLDDQLSRNAREISEEGQKYDTLIKKEQDFLKQKGVTEEQRKTTAVNIGKITDAKKTALNDLAIRQETELQKKISDLRQGFSKIQATEYDKQRIQINAFYDGLAKDNAGNESKLAEIKLARAKDLSDAELREKERLEKAKVEIEEEYNTLTGTKIENDLAKLNKKYDDEIQALREKFGVELQATQEFQDAVDKINGKRKAEIALTDQQYEEKKKEFIIGAAQQAADATFSIISASQQAKLNYTLNSIESERQGELSQKNLTEKQKLVINERYDAKVKEAKLKGWKAEKAASIAQAVVNGALAVTKVLAQTGILSPFAIPAIVAGTAAQIAVIVATKPPEFGVGVRNFKGGKAIVGEKGPEAINENGNLWIADQPMVVDLAPGTDVYTADDTSQMLKGRTLGEQLYPQMNYSIDTTATKKAEQEYRSAVAPAYTSTSTGTSGNGNISNSSIDTDLKDLMKEMIKAQREANDKKVYQVYSELEAFQKTVMETRAAQTG